MDEGGENIPGRVNYLQLDCLRFESGNDARLDWSAKGQSIKVDLGLSSGADRKPMKIFTQRGVL